MKASGSQDSGDEDANAIRIREQKLQELRDCYDSTSLPESVGRAKPDDRVADEVLVSTSIRLPRSLMRQVRERADAAGVPATILLRQWLTKRLTAGNADSVVSVSDLRRFIAERSYPAA